MFILVKNIGVVRIVVKIIDCLRFFIFLDLFCFGVFGWCKLSG